jgi:hypothetical protein
LDNVNIFNNDATDNGGGFYIDMGAGMSHNLDSCVICDNTATYGDGFYIYVEMMPFTVDLVNCIVCDEITEFSPYKYDSFSATYCNVNGGCEGEGNIDVTPNFVDAANGNYRLLGSSDCIDAGNPDPAFNDPEDPASPGNALSPAMGTVRADMGSFGGPLADDWVTPPTAPIEPDEGDIIITEICGDGVDGVDDDDGFVELYNKTTETLDLVNVVVNYYNNGSMIPTASVPLSNFSLDADSYLIIAQNSGAFTNAYATTPDISNSNFLFDGGKDVIEVYLNPSKAGLIDSFNDIANPWSWLDDDPLERNTTGSGSNASAWTANSSSTGSPGEGNDTPLPVTLASFTAFQVNNSTILQWQTVSETNNSGWNVYRAESANWNESSKLNSNLIAGSGTTSEIQNYEFEDTDTLENQQMYWYWIESVDYGNHSIIYDPANLLYDAEDEPESPEVQILYGLQQNYPNPFNPSTEILFRMKEEGNVQISIYNVKGEKVATIFDEFVPSETLQKIIWNGTSHNGKTVASGLYFYRLESSEHQEIKKMLLIK